MTYKAHLKNCAGLADSSRAQAENAFTAALTGHFGDAAQAASAKRLFDDAIARHGGEPLPLGASEADCDAVDNWNTGYGLAVEAAFSGWVRIPHDARFEVIPL
jgi:hypothetical protein